MMIERITLSNYGIYGGTTSLDLTSNAIEKTDQPLTIIRGHNGAGKTTLLNAVRLALYGDGVKSERKLSEKEYKKFLSEKIHFSSPNATTYVELSFGHRIHEQGISYKVRRSWNLQNGTFEYDEKFVQSLNGGIEENLSKEDWDAIVSELVPKGVSQFFFFDGEKIQEIADQKNSEGLNYAIRSLLGLNMIERLRKDVMLYLQRNKKTKASDNTDVEDLSKHSEQAQASLDELRRERADLNQKVRNAVREVGLAELRLFKEGGMSNEERSKLKETEETLRIKQQEIKADLVEALGNERIFQIAPQLTSKLSVIAKTQKTKTEAKIISNFLEGLDSSEISEAEIKKLKSVWSRSYQAQQASSSAELSPTSLALLQSIQNASVFSGEKQAEIIGLIDRDLLDVRNRLLANEEVAAMKARENFLKAQRAEEKAQASLKDMDVKIKEQAKESEAIKKQIAAHEESILQLASLDRQTRIASQTIKVLEQYETEIMAKKLKEISENFVLIFSKLTRKKDLIAEIIIEPKTFEVTLKGNGKDGIVESDSLSAGERQLYAISLLWALGKVSGKNIPLIIDTPFSRLDIETRHKIVEHYIPFAAKQVVILFTDSELTKDLEPKLAPITRSSIEINVAAGKSGNQIRENRANAA